MIQQKKNILYTFLFSAVALCIFSAATLFGTYIFSEWFGIIVGVAMVVAAIPLHNIAKNHKFLYFISYVLNTVGCGFSASAYYIVQKVPASLGEFFAATLPAMLPLLLYTAVFMLVGKGGKIVCSIFCALDLALAAFAVYAWVTKGGAFYSFLFFSSVVAFFYIIAIKSVSGDEEILTKKGSFVRTVSFSSFGIFIIVTLIVAAILSEGEILDGFDADIFGNPKKKSKIAAATLAVEALDVAGDVISDNTHKEEDKKN